MQSSSKQWYVHTGSQQEGPLSQEAVLAKISAGTATPQHFAWSPGMPNWIAIAEIPDLNGTSVGSPPLAGAPEVSLVSATSATPENTASHSVSLSATQDSSDLSALIEISQKPEAHEPTGIMDLAKLNAAVGEAKAAEKKEKLARLGLFRATALGLGKVLSVLLIGLALVAVGVAIWISSDPAAKDKAASTITRYLPISLYSAPKSFGLNDNERQQFERAANAQVGTPTYALAISRGSTGPRVLFAGPWTDQTRIDVLLKGEPMSLVGSTEHHQQVTLVTSGHFGSAALAQPFPKGEYVATLTDSAINTMIGQSRVSFKDASYANELNAYHTQTVARLKSEVESLKTVVSLFESEYEAQTPTLTILSTTPSLNAWKNAARTLHARHAPFFEKLNPAMQNYRPDTLKTDVLLWSLAQRALMLQLIERNMDQLLEEVLIAKVIAPRWKADQAALVQNFQSRSQQINDLKTSLASADAALASGQFVPLLENTP